jgi:hypothetical protein
MLKDSKPGKKGKVMAEKVSFCKKSRRESMSDFFIKLEKPAAAAAAFKYSQSFNIRN